MITMLCFCCENSEWFHWNARVLRHKCQNSNECVVVWCYSCQPMTLDFKSGKRCLLYAVVAQRIRIQNHDHAWNVHCRVSSTQLLTQYYGLPSIAKNVLTYLDLICIALNETLVTHRAAAHLFEPLSLVAAQQCIQTSKLISNKTKPHMCSHRCSKRIHALFALSHRTNIHPSVNSALNWSVPTSA